jgi:hypothetical protein
MEWRRCHVNPHTPPGTPLFSKLSGKQDAVIGQPLEMQGFASLNVIRAVELMLRAGGAETRG